jgi:hypothetical protein
VYIDAMLAAMDDGGRAATIAEFAAVNDGDRGSPGFMHVRAMCIEAYYSDFVAPGIEAASAWQEIDFNTPQATRLAKDWSYMGITGRRLDGAPQGAEVPASPAPGADLA